MEFSTSFLIEISESDGLGGTNGLFVWLFSGLGGLFSGLGGVFSGLGGLTVSIGLTSSLTTLTG